MNYKLILIATVTLLFVACGNKPSTEKEIKRESPKNGVEVLYFHGKQRCVTCNSIERLTREVLETHFTGELKNGTIMFHIIDISQPENEQIADKYEVSWSSLFVNKWMNGVEIKTNMTDFGFSYAKNQPEVFKQGLKEKLEAILAD